METSVEMRIQDVRDMLTEKTDKILRGREEDKARIRIELRRLGYNAEEAFEEDLAYCYSKIDEHIKKALDEVHFIESFCDASANGRVRVSKEDFKWLAK